MEQVARAETLLYRPGQKMGEVLAGWRQDGGGEELAAPVGKCLGEALVDLEYSRATLIFKQGAALRQASAFEELTSPRYSTCRCTVRPRATRLFSTIDQ